MFLPLHAAGIYGVSDGECCSDYIVSSYTPTLTALLRAQKANLTFLKGEAKLGFVAAKKAWDPSMPTLLNVEDEVRQVLATAEGADIPIDESRRCIGDRAVVTRVAEVLQSTNVAHIACHGTQDAFNALSSGFCLSDGNLTISRLMDLDLKDAFLAFLSACETARGDVKQPDQTIHLAAAMLFVGFRSVVATMW
jgi:CHAT domain-containing protein